MTKDEVRAACGTLLAESNAYLWQLKRQFRPATPGLYPFFDSRRVYLYFDDADRLIAINVRGSYSTYP